MFDLYELDINIYNLKNCLFSNVISLQKWLAQFYCRIRHSPKNQYLMLLNLEKRQYLPHYWSDQGLKGTIVNRALPSLHGCNHVVTWNYAICFIKRAGSTLNWVAWLDITAYTFCVVLAQIIQLLDFKKQTIWAGKELIEELLRRTKLV